MQEKHYAFLAIFLVCATIVAGFFFIKHDLLDQRGGDAEEEVEIIEEVVKPEDVDLRINYTGIFHSHCTMPVSIEGEPPGSNITWYLDDVEFDHGKTIQLGFPRSDYFTVRVSVKWDRYEKNVSERFAVKNPDDIGHLGYEGWYLKPEWTPTGFGISIESGITVPTLWINVSMWVKNGSMNYTFNIGSLGYDEIFENLEFDELNESNGTYTRSFFYDKDFFKAREVNGDYILWIIAEVYGSEDTVGNMKVYHELRY